MRNASPLAALAMLLPLAACAGDGGAYPSLAQRPAEKHGFAEPEAPAAAPLIADPALDAKAAGLRSSLGKIIAGFDLDAAKADAAVSRPGARTTGGDAWLDAQTALAALDDWRAQASSLATDADEAAGARAATLAAPYPALDAARAAANAEVERQDATIRWIAGRLPTA